MQIVDITTTPAACRQIARLFRTQKAHSVEMIERASAPPPGHTDEAHAHAGRRAA